MKYDNLLLTMQVENHIKLILWNGDKPYVHSLSYDQLKQALKHELYFIGLYAHDDIEGKREINSIVDSNLSRWLYEAKGLGVY